MRLVDDGVKREAALCRVGGLVVAPDFEAELMRDFYRFPLLDLILEEVELELEGGKEERR